MNPILLPLYGPIAIHSYGLCIAIGILLFIFLVRQHPLYKKLNLEPIFSTIISVGVFSGLLGGRILYLISQNEPFWDITQWFTIWEGGFAILGGIIGIITAISAYLYFKKIPILSFFDLVCLYTPLLQSVSRVGCFLAGCCYGLQTKSSFGVTYTNPLSLAPLGVTIHPTQLYSSFALFCIFIFLIIFVQKKVRYPGQIFAIYLILESCERFFIDFLRADREMFTKILSLHQIVSLMIFSMGILLFGYTIYSIKKQCP